jgi:small subunit ribosomal protein S17
MKTFEGKIVSVKMNSTVIVEIVRRTPHPLYKKLIRRSKKFKSDTNGLELALGQKVKIAETKPAGKGKFFKVLEVIK